MNPENTSVIHSRPAPSEEQYQEASTIVNIINNGNMDVVLFLGSILAERDVKINDAKKALETEAAQNVEFRKTLESSRIRFDHLRYAIREPEPIGEHLGGRIQIECGQEDIDKALALPKSHATKRAEWLEEGAEILKRLMLTTILRGQNDWAEREPKPEQEA